MQLQDILWTNIKIQMTFSTLAIIYQGHTQNCIIITNDYRCFKECSPSSSGPLKTTECSLTTWLKGI